MSRSRDLSKVLGQVNSQGTLSNDNLNFVPGQIVSTVYDSVGLMTTGTAASLAFVNNTDKAYFSNGDGWIELLRADSYSSF